MKNPKFSRKSRKGRLTVGWLTPDETSPALIEQSRAFRASERTPSDFERTIRAGRGTPGLDIFYK